MLSGAGDAGGQTGGSCAEHADGGCDGCAS
jgi:hypothetical protein